MTDLKPCPFCNSPDVKIIKERNGSDIYDALYICCMECECRTKTHEFPKNALIGKESVFREKYVKILTKLWNRRANEN